MLTALTGNDSGLMVPAYVIHCLLQAGPGFAKCEYLHDYSFLEREDGADPTPFKAGRECVGFERVSFQNIQTAVAMPLSEASAMVSLYKKLYKIKAKHG